MNQNFCNLCRFVEMIIGKDFLKSHKSVTFNFDGEDAPLEFSEKSTPCNLTAIEVEPPLLFKYMSTETKPITCKSRRYNTDDEKFIQDEVRRMLDAGIIEPSVSPWRAQVLVVPATESYRKRLVVDYSRTVNRFTELDAYPLPRIDDMVRKISKYSVFSTLDLKSAYHQIPIREEERQYTAFEAGGKLYQFTRIPVGVTNGVAAFQRKIDRIIDDENLEDTFAFVDNVTICGHNQEEHDKHMKEFLRTAEKYNITLNHNKSILSTTKMKLLSYIVEHNMVKPDPDRLRPLVELPEPTDTVSQRRVIGMFAYYSRWIKDFSQKIHTLVRSSDFPLPDHLKSSFEQLKNDVKNSAVTAIDPSQTLIVETDASDYAIGATLTQNSRPVAFFSRSLKSNGLKLHSAEKEAYAIVEALRERKHFLIGTRFKLMTDQKSVAFMFNSNSKGKIKMTKLQDGESNSQILNLTLYTDRETKIIQLIHSPESTLVLLFYTPNNTLKISIHHYAIPE